MRVTQNVVNDLLPLYEAGEASEDTRALVDEFLRDHPELKQEIMARGAAVPLASLPPAPGADLERAALQRTRRYLRARGILLSLAIACWIIPFSFAFDSHGLRWILWRDNPSLALLFIAVSVVFSAAHTVLGWRHRHGSPRR